MRKLSAPTDKFGVSLTAGSVFNTCIDSIKDKALKARLSKINIDVSYAEAEYERLASAENLHLFPCAALIGACTKQELNKVYTNQMVRQGKPGRIIYDRILNSSPLKICPLCGVGPVRTLDHHLPKAHFPVLSVAPGNLVPACDWCQGKKRDSYPTTKEEQTIHPYFDDFSSCQWLVADVVEGSPAAFQFYVSGSTTLSPIAKSRLSTHLSAFGLEQLFSINAASELVGIQFLLTKLHDLGGETAVRTYLSECYKSRSNAHINAWQTAMYAAAAENDWFCNGGFGA